MTSFRSLWSVSAVVVRIMITWCLSVKNRHQHNTVHTTLAMSNVDFHVAPMQCYTNLPFRRLCSSLSPSSTYWTEMEKADDLLPNAQEALIQRLGDPKETSHQAQHKLVLQLGSNDPQKVLECVQAAMELENHRQSHYLLKEINLNCGCPAIDSGGAPTYGASLMKNPTLTAALVHAVRRGVEMSNCGQRPNMDISVKCRIGVVEHADDLSSSESSLAAAYDYDRLHQYIAHIHDAGANHVILHARPAVLSGLSPVKNRIVPTLRYEMAQQIARDFRDLKVTLNGGITSLSQLAAEYDGSSTDNKISSFMAGRWILQRPLDLIGIEGWLNEHHHQGTSHDTKSSALAIAKGALEDYLDYCIESASHFKTGSISRPTADLCLPLFLVIEQLRDAYDGSDDDNCGGLNTTHNGDQVSCAAKSPPLLSYEEIESLYDLLQDGVAELNYCICKDGTNKSNEKNSSVNFKRLSASFKSLVGTKVANKWKRNRAELLCAS